MVGQARLCAANESSSVPVNPVPAAPVAAPIPHFRKLAFGFGAIATIFALVFVQQMTGWSS
jgi:hypothetical protein